MPNATASLLPLENKHEHLTLTHNCICCGMLTRGKKSFYSVKFFLGFLPFIPCSVPFSHHLPYVTEMKKTSWLGKCFSDYVTPVWLSYHLRKGLDLKKRESGFSWIKIKQMSMKTARHIWIHVNICKHVCVHTHLISHLLIVFWL